MKIKDVLQYLENKYPLDLQEDFDNCGIQCGDKERDLTGILVCFEISDDTIDEAIAQKKNLIISHHPLLLRRGIFKIEPTHRVGRIICKSLENKMVLYSMHTNLDVAEGGVNDCFADKLHLLNTVVLSPSPAKMQKIAFFVPQSHSSAVKDALFQVGCGRIGNYENCAYHVNGFGSFKPLEDAHPFIGECNHTERVEEERVEMVFPAYLQKRVIEALYRHHPYEEPAFDLYVLENPLRRAGLGRVGKLEHPLNGINFLQLVKDTFSLKYLRYYGDTERKISRVAVCGGSGSSFITNAIAANADAYITGDVKYHDFHLADGKMLIIDIGHFESEHFIKEIIFSELKEKFSNFAVSISEEEKMQIQVI
jgi:dinuclear metal center YbgI/SA1388 family protein